MAFYGLFCIGKLTAKSNRFAASVVQFGNLTLLSRNDRTHVAKITISEYKHNTSRRPFDILIAREVSSAFCPVLALAILRIGENLLLAPFFVMLIKVQFYLTDLMWNYSVVQLIEG